MDINTIEACGSRLPCGLCLITNRPCAFAFPQVTYGTPEVTCTTSNFTIKTTKTTEEE